MNFAAALTEEKPEEEVEKESALEVVEIDGLAVLKIVKHCKEYLPQLVTGQLLGLDNETSLEVTNCFPFPTRPEGDTEEYDDNEGAEYQIEMMRSLREVNVDNNTVGWYQSTYLGSHITENLIATQFNYQESIPKCVCLIFDPLKTAQGNLALKAVRLTDSFLALYKGGEFTLDSILKSGVCAEDIFEELPIEVRNSNLIKAYLLQMDESSIKRSVAEPEGVTTNPFLEKNLECLIESIDDLSQESARFQYHQRALGRHMAAQSGMAAKRKQENEHRRRQGLPPLTEEDIMASNKPPQEPSRLDSLLFNTQISNYCQQINQFTGQSFNKHFLINALRQQ
jgi:translation initiation factor 3 subunit H